MDYLKDLLRSDLSDQAYLIIGSPGSILPFLVETLKNDKNISWSSVDLFVREFDAFGISESRLIKKLQYSKTADNQTRFFFLGIHFITTEAQNALLKTLEEPSEKTKFFIVAKNQEIFLPTVRSRCHVHTPRIDKFDIDTKEAESFLNKTIPERLVEVESLLKLKDKNELRFKMSFLFDSLEVVLEKKIKDQSLVDLELILEARKRMYEPGSLPKMILEQLALSLGSGKGN